MSSFLWLLLYLAPLLGITAALFAWFGWRWRGSDLQKRIDELAAQMNGAQAALRQAEAGHAAALALSKAAPPPEMPAAPDVKAEELQMLRDELKAAQTTAHLRQDEAAKAHEAARALETEMTRLLADLDELRAARSAAEAELASLRSAPPAAEVAGPPAAPAETTKGKRKRSPTVKLKAPASEIPATLRGKIAVLESQLSAHQAGLATLTQERDDWQRRISKLEEKSPPDPAGLGLARRSLADSEKRLLTATTEIERLQNQTRVLHRVEEAAATISIAPDDDLTQIKGIKKVISEQLRAHGIRTWRQIALWDEAERRAFSELLAFKNRAAREQWQEQARALHEAAHGPLP
ncbi:hypothetical protein [Prosthecobacter sp.]|uniref:hypothetical protein n=1 Tax=Prosthecobacter sp. TaxID=1965333 RepID=UPI003783CE5C